MSINKVLISGNLVREPEQKVTASGTGVLEFTVAVNERRKNNNGEWEDKPAYVDCTMFGTRADAVAPFLAKGMKVAIEGKLRWHQWEKDGQKRSKLDVLIDDIEFMSKAEHAGKATAPRDAYADDDCPF